ncbi:beta strand repeat-containing protein, partial [Aquirufa sp. OSTEICH-129A]
MAIFGLYLFTLSFDSYAQRSYSPLAPSFAQAAVIPYSQDVFVAQSEDSLDLTFAKKRVLKAKNGVDFHLRSFFSKADYRDQLFKFFPGKRKQMDASFDERAVSLRNVVLGNGLFVPIQFVKWENMHGAMASYSSVGPDGRPRIYMNKEYSEGQGNFVYPEATDSQMISLLLQEYGHAMDDYLNGLEDSPGDEGDLFATTLLKLDVNDDYYQSILVRNDHNKIKVDGKTIHVEDAGVYLAQAWVATVSGNNFTTAASAIASTPIRLETAVISSAWNATTGGTGSIACTFFFGASSQTGTVNRTITSSPTGSVLAFLNTGSTTAGYVLKLPNSTTTINASTSYASNAGSEGTIVHTFSAAIGVGSTLTLTAGSVVAGTTTTLTANSKTTANANTNNITATFSSTSGTAIITGTNPGTTAGSGTAVVTVTDTQVGSKVFNCELKNSVGWYVVETATLTVTPGTASKFVITGTGTQTAGGSQTITITAQDTYGNTATAYTGAKNLTFSGAASSPNPVTAPTAQNSSAADIDFGSTTAESFSAGVATTVMKLYDAETALIAVTDGTISAAGADRLSVVVSPASYSKLAVSLATPQTNGSVFTGTNTLTAQDVYGNTVTSFDASTNNVTVTNSLGGTVSGLGSGANNVLNQAGDFTSGVANLTSDGMTYTGTSGTGTFTFTPATGTAITSSSIVVNPGAATKLVITGTGTQTAGNSQNITLTAYDASGNIATSYTGDKTLTFSGANASINPATNPTVTNKNAVAINFGSSTLITFTNGVASSVPMSLFRAESATISVTDGSISSTGGDNLSVTVSAAAFNKLAVSLASPQTNGTAFTGTNILTAQDAYGNTVSTFSAATNNVTVTTSLTGTVSGLGSGLNHILNQAGDFVSGVANLTSLGLKYTGTSGSGTFTFTPTSGTAATSSSITVNAGAATKFSITGTGTQTAGNSQFINIFALDASGNVATTYTGDKTLTFSGATASPNPVTNPTITDKNSALINFGTGTVITFTTGAAINVVLTVYKAESATINASDGAINSNTGGTLNVTVSSSTMTKLAVSLASPQINGTAFTGTNTLTAQDAYGNTATGFNASTNNVTVTNSLGGTVTGLGSGGTNVLNQAGDFTSGVANLTTDGMIYTGTSGAGTFTFTPATGTAVTSSSVTVNPGAATRLVVTGTASQTAGATNSITITAKDASGNTVTTYTGSKNLTFSGANSSTAPVTTAKVTNSSATDIAFGSTTALTFASGSVTTNMKLYRAETALVAVTDGSISAAGADRLTVTVSPSTMTKLAVSLASPQINGTTFTGTNTLTAQDAFGNTATGFNASTNNVTVTNSLGGTVTGLGSGGTNVLNQAGDFTSGVANLTSDGMIYTGTSGAGTFTFTPATGTAVTSSSVTVSPGAATRLVVTGTASQTAGATNSITISARDASGNLVTTYTGSKNLTFSGASSSTAPVTTAKVTNSSAADIAFGSTTALTFASGSVTTNMKLYHAETALVAVTDGSISAAGADRLTVTVSPSTMTKLAVSLASPQINGTAFTGTNTLTAQDAYGNTATGFNASTNNVTVTNSLGGTVTGLGSGGTNVLNQAGDFTSGVANLTTDGITYTGTSGAGTFTFTPATGTAVTSSSVTVNPGAATRLVVTGTASQTAGATNSITISARDASGNLVTTYTGSKNLTFSGASSSTAPVTTAKVTNSSAADIAFGSTTALTFASGSVTTNMKLYHAETALVAVTDGSISAAGADRLTVTVSPSTMTKLAVSLASPQINGTAFTGTNTLTAQDAYGNTATGFNASTNNVTVTNSLGGTVTGLGSGGTNVLNQAGDFTSGVANLTTDGITYTGTSGAGTFTFTPATGTAITSSSVTVNPGAATRLVVTGTASQTAGATNSITISARDASGNLVTTYTGSKNLTFSGASSSTAPVTTAKVTNSSAADIAFGSTTALTFASGSVTTNMKLYHAETALVAVTDGSISAAGADRLTVTVSPSTMTKLAVSLASPQINGTAFTGTNTLTAQDAFGNTATGFNASTNNVTVTNSLGGTVTGLGSGGTNVLNQAGDFTSGVANLTTDGITYTGTSGAGTFTFTPATGTAVTSSSVTINAGAATKLVVTGTGTQTAGGSQTVTVTAQDANGNTATTYTGAKTITFSGANASPSPATTPTVAGTNFGTGTSMTFTAGVASASMILYKAESATVNASDGTINSNTGGTLNVTVGSSTMTKLAVSLASPQINGTAFTGTNTLTAQDAYGNTATGFDASTNNVTVTTSLTGSISGLSGGNKLSGGLDFVGGVANLTSLGITYSGTSGSGTFTFTPVTGTAVTSSSVSVDAGAATKFSITGTATQTAGNAQTINIFAFDANGNIATTYTGDKTLTFSGANASLLPPTSPKITDKNSAQVDFGTGTVITFTTGFAINVPMSLYKAEAATVNVTDGTINSNTGGTLNVTVNPAPFSKLAVSLASPQINGTAFTGTNTLTAQDAYGNTVTGFNASTNNVTVTNSLGGTVTGLGSGGTNVLNQAGDFTSGVANLTSDGMIYTGTSGVGTFTFTPATGTAITSSSVTVNPGAVTRLVVTGAAIQGAGTSNSITITAKDASGNTVTTYTGSKNLTFSGASSSTAPVTTAKVTNSSATDIAFGSTTALTFASGSVTTNMKLYHAETALVAVTDGSISATGADRLTVAVSAAAFNKLAVSLASPQINGTAFTGTNTLTAQDAFGNTVIGFNASGNNITVTTSLTGSISGLSGTNKLNSAMDFPSGVADLTSLGLIFTGTSGVGTFTFTPSIGTPVTSGSVTINAGAATKLVVTGTGTQTAGGSQTVTVTAQDANGNTATTYTGAKTITFSGANASPSPATTPTVAGTNFGTGTSMTFTAGVASASMILYKAESATVNASDGT